MKVKVNINIIHWATARKRFGDIALFRVHWNFEKRNFEQHRVFIDMMSCFEIELLGVSFIVFFKRNVLSKYKLKKVIKEYFAEMKIW